MSRNKSMERSGHSLLTSVANLIRLMGEAKLELDEFSSMPIGGNLQTQCINSAASLNHCLQSCQATENMLGQVLNRGLLGNVSEESESESTGEFDPPLSGQSSTV